MRRIISLILIIWLYGCKKEKGIVFNIQGPIKEICPLIIISEDSNFVKSITGWDDIVYDDYLGITSNDTVWLRSNDISIISHEMFHLTTNTLQSMGVFLNDSTEEVYAYQIEFYIREINKHIE